MTDVLDREIDYVSRLGDRVNLNSKDTVAGALHIKDELLADIAEEHVGAEVFRAGRRPFINGEQLVSLAQACLGSR